MSNKIYKLAIIKRFTEAYYQLSDEARDNFWKKILQNEEEGGAKFLLSCDARWCDEAVSGWGVIEYPDVRAVQEITAMNEKDGLFRYVESQTFLGKLMMGDGIPDLQTPEAVYQLFIIKNQANDAWDSLTPDTRERIFAGITESIERLGGKLGIGCDINWSNEECSTYGIIAWPNVEAQQAHFQDIEKIGWHRYVYARTILGKKLP